MSIQEEINEWDGKSADDISDIYKCHCHDDAFQKNIINLISKSPSEKGATWLLKRHLENENKISNSEVSRIFKKLISLEHWESKLHILQSLPFLRIPKPDKKVVELFLRTCLSDSNKFVRAWAYNGFHELALQYPEYVKETKQFFDMAMQDEVPSVKARIRNIMKNGF